MTIMKRTAAPVNLVDRVIDERAITKMEANRKEVMSIKDSLQGHFDEMKKAVVSSRAMLAFFNGRIELINFELAEKVVNKAEADLFDMAVDMKFLTTTLERMDAIKSKVDEGRKSESNILSIEKFLYDDSSNHPQNMKIQENFEKLSRESKNLQHSVKALLQLKAGK